MTALNVISIASARAWLGGVNDPDAVIQQIIEAAIHWVEKYTSYRMYERQITFTNYVHGQGFPLFPIAINSVKNSSGVVIPYTTSQGTFNTYVWAPANSVIVATVGYANVADIEPTLKSAANLMITYLYDNRDLYQVIAPTNVQLMLNVFRRSATI